MKKALLIIASQNFRDEEFEHPRRVLEERGVKVEVASTQTGEIRGTKGMSVLVDKLIDQVNASDYNAIIFVGGQGAAEYFNSPIAHQLCQAAVRDNKVLGAICIAPSILANAGVLKNKRATAFPSEENNLRVKGANYTGAPLEIDGKIITANGPAVAEEFGEKIAAFV